VTRNSNLGFAVLLLAGSVCARNPPKQAPAPPPAKPPIIVQNPNGTLTAQKEPPKDAKPKGLVIPRQVVIPFATTPQPPKK
jgi:hypothetical protein